jgi:hypothetical protein
MLETEYELTKEDETELRELGIQCFEDFWKRMCDKKQQFSVQFKIASASGYLAALHELGYISTDETEVLIRSLEMRV